MTKIECKIVNPNRQRFGQQATVFHGRHIVYFEKKKEVIEVLFEDTLRESFDMNEVAFLTPGTHWGTIPECTDEECIGECMEVSNG